MVRFKSWYPADDLPHVSRRSQSRIGSLAARFLRRHTDEGLDVETLQPAIDSLRWRIEDVSSSHARRVKKRLHRGGRFETGRRERISIERSTFEGVDFSNQRFLDFWTADSVFDGCDFSGVQLGNVNFSHKPQSRFRECRFDRADLTNHVATLSLSSGGADVTP